MGFTALRCGDGMSGIFLKDGARLAGASSAPAEDLARQATRATADKVFLAAAKKFSKVTLRVSGAEVNVWDLFCHGSFRHGGAFRNALVAEFLGFSINRCINGMSDELRQLIEVSACGDRSADENEGFNRTILAAVICADVNAMVQQHGATLQALYVARSPSLQLIENGASPL
jgi:hypothetical protein